MGDPECTMKAMTVEEEMFRQHIEDPLLVYDASSGVIIYVYMHICICIYICMHICVCIYVCVHVCVHVYFICVRM